MTEPPAHPRTFWAVVARVWLRLMGGWRYEGALPEPRRAVCLAFPHTSNLDGLLLVLLARSVGLSIAWMVKDVWGRPPIGWVVRGFGGVPIDRSKANGMVDQMAQAFAQRDALLLVIPPEGTRSHTARWKSGFYHIARAASVPVVPGYLDFRRRRGGFGPPITLTGSAHEDMDRIRAFYAGLGGGEMARFPAQVGPMALREEDGPAA